jgi:hypothetical protein
VLHGDDNAVATIAKPALDWDTVANPNMQPTNAIVHNFRLFVIGNLNRAHMWYASNPNDFEDFQTPSSSNGYSYGTISAGVGERLWGLAEYQGVLFLWKYPFGIFYLDTDPLTAGQPGWGYQTRSLSVGCAPSPHAVLATDDDVLFIDPNGHFHLLSAVATLGGTADSDLTRFLGLQQWTETNIDLPSLAQLDSVFDTSTKTAWFGLRSRQAAAAASVNNDLVMRFEFGNPTITQTISSISGMFKAPRVTTARCWTADALCLKHRYWVDRAVPVISGINQSYMVVPLQYGARTDYDFVAKTPRTVGIGSTVYCAEDDFDAQQPGRLRNIRKRFTSLEVVAQGENLNQPLTLQLWVDNVPRQTLVVNQSNQRRLMRKLNVGDGYTIQVRATTDGSVAQDLPLLGLIIYYRPTGTDMSRKT